MDDELRKALDNFQAMMTNAHQKKTIIPGSNICTFKTIMSDALAVHPEQIQEAREVDRRAGLSVQYDNEGRPELSTRGVRKKYLKAHGFHDRRGGYGD